jgi:hypothetical protein
VSVIVIVLLILAIVAGAAAAVHPPYAVRWLGIALALIAAALLVPHLG